MTSRKRFTIEAAEARSNYYEDCTDLIGLYQKVIPDANILDPSSTVLEAVSEWRKTTMKKEITVETLEEEERLGRLSYRESCCVSPKNWEVLKQPKKKTAELLDIADSEDEWCDGSL